MTDFDIVAAKVRDRYRFALDALGKGLEIAGHRAQAVRFRDALERVTGARDLDAAKAIAADALNVDSLVEETKT